MKVQPAIETNVNGFTVNVIIDTRTGEISGFEAMTIVPTEEQAIEIAAKFPKFVNIKVFNIGNVEGVAINIRADFSTNKVTGEKNETSVKRVRKFLEICDSNGLETRFNDAHCLNQLRSREEFEKFLAT